MPFIRFGTNLALEECKAQFKNRHWNCTLFQERELLGNILDSGEDVETNGRVRNGALFRNEGIGLHPRIDIGWHRLHDHQSV